jgi:hypothetical protein
MKCRNVHSKWSLGTTSRFRPLQCIVVGVLAAVLLPTAASAGPGQSPTVTLTIHALANIYGAGHTVAPEPGGGGAGELPPVYEFPAASGQILQFSSVEGTISADGGMTHGGPDGTQYGISVFPWDGISGIRDNRAGFYLVGVFLADAEPHDPAPGALNFSRHHNFSSLSPQLGVVFFIGDGHTYHGQVQTFDVPDGASRLYLGLADACGGFGLTGCYGTNLGSLVARFTLG